MRLEKRARRLEMDAREKEVEREMEGERERQKERGER